MAKQYFIRLHWRLFFPLVGLLWLIIGITFYYFVSHEKQRQRENLENRLLNVNNTVIEAYSRGDNLQRTVDFIRLFTDNTTLAPLRITVYDADGKMIADNPAATISIYDSNGEINPEMKKLWETNGHATIQDIAYDNVESMISSRSSDDGVIHSFAALPYDSEVKAFLSIDSMVWIVVVILGVISSLLAYLGVRAICRNIYSLQDFARGIASDHIPDNIESLRFSDDELGDVTRNLLTLYRDKIHAEQEKLHHEYQIGINVSHELKTPVGIIKGYIDTILSDRDMPESVRLKFLERTQQTTDRLVTLVSDLSMVMSLQEEGCVIKGTRINMYQFALKLAEDIRLGHIADSMSFEFDIPEECCVTGHESLLTTALFNLIYNSAAHSKGTLISFRWLKEEDSMNYFTFSDNGVGIEEEHLGRIFDLFYRVDSGRSRKNGGSGLGLPLVLRIIKAMGGKLTVENQPEGGLKFTFSLPAYVNLG